MEKEIREKWLICFLRVNERKKGCVDSHAVDQLPFMALSGKGRILCDVTTEHAKTNDFVIEKFLL